MLLCSTYDGIAAHVDFKIRYPQEFEKFHADEYLNNIAARRNMLAQYDNSVLYNDHVVSSLMTLFEKEESLVFYFPDHGIDVQESSDRYVSHAIEGNSISCKAGANKPFVIYTSPLYQDNYKNECERIKASVTKKFCTENLIFSLVDILGI